VVHDLKNMSFRLRLLLSNLDEHWQDPEFPRTVRDLLADSVERLDEVAGRFVAHEDAVLIKVALEVDGLLRQVADRPSRRSSRGAPAGPAVSLALGGGSRIWGDPYYLGDAFGSLLENAREAAAPGGRSSCVRTPRGRQGGRRPSSRSSTTALA
jgi:hypothetical protein